MFLFNALHNYKDQSKVRNIDVAWTIVLCCTTSWKTRFGKNQICSVFYLLIDGTYLPSAYDEREILFRNVRQKGLGQPALYKMRNEDEFKSAIVPRQKEMI